MEDFSHEARPHDSRALRWLFLALGFLFVGLGVVGAALPVMPTTPFLLVAAACFARASPRFYNALLNNKAFGPLIVEWRRYRSIPYRTKLWAIGLMSGTLAVSVIFFVPDPLLQGLLALLGALLAAWMYAIPSRTR